MPQNNFMNSISKKFYAIIQKIKPHRKPQCNNHAIANQINHSQNAVNPYLEC